MSAPWDSGHGFVRRVFTTGVALPNRMYVFGAFAGVAWTAVDGLWLATVVSVVLWGLLMQFVLYDTYTDGWVAGKKSLVEAALVANKNAAGEAISVVGLLDLCERHDVPMEEVAQLIWKDKS